VSDGSIVKRLGPRSAMLLYLAGMAPAEADICTDGLIPAPKGG
jgi:hypothetical protein